MTERELCYSMYELLSPKKNPECGKLYLELFDKHVLRLNMTAEELDSARVLVDDHKAPEEDRYHMQFIENKRKRIDLVIITNKRFIPIEVKIEADDQPKQCDDYWLEAKKYHETHFFSESPVLYYLSPEGYFPSKKSANHSGYKKGSFIRYPLIRSDKIDHVAFRSELIHWFDACLEQISGNSSCVKKLESLYEEVIEIINELCRSEPKLEECMLKFFTTLDGCFTEDFCRKYHLKRGSNRRGEVGDYHNYRRYIERFFGKEFAEAGINFLCTDSIGNVINANDKYLCFNVSCYNGVNNEFGYLATLSASFFIFDYSVRESLCKEKEIKKFLSGRNILPQEFVNNIFAGLIGSKELHDAQGKYIDFRNVEETLARFKNQEDIDRAVDSVMIEIEKLLERFVNG